MTCARSLGRGLIQRRCTWPTLFAFGKKAIDRRGDGAVGAAPADDQQVAFVATVHAGGANVRLDGGHLGSWRSIVIFWWFSGSWLTVPEGLTFLQATDPVLQAWSAGNGPGACALGVAQVGLEGERDR
jgi:hypothetical protein